MPAGAPKVGPREKLYAACMKHVKSTNKMMGVAADDSHTLKVSSTGITYYETTQQAEDPVSYPFWIATLEQFRHSMVGLGLATEHAINYYNSWFSARLCAGDVGLKIVEKTYRRCLRRIDNAPATYNLISVVQLEAGNELDLVRAAFRGSADKEEAREKQKAAAEKEGSASKVCKNWNIRDANAPDGHRPCGVKEKGKCVFKHVCAVCGSSKHHAYECTGGFTQ